MTQMTTYWILFILMSLVYCIDILRLNMKYKNNFDEHDELISAIEEQNNSIMELIVEHNAMVEDYDNDMKDFEELKTKYKQLNKKYKSLLKSTKDKKEITK